MKNKFTAAIIIVITLMFCYVHSHAEDWPLGFPSVNTNQDDIPLTTLKTIALAEAVKTWGDVTLGVSIPCSGPDDKISYYYFVFKIGTSAFEDYSIIQSTIKQARVDYEHCIQTTPTEVQSGKKWRGKYKESHDRFIKARNKKWGAYEYGTIVLAARKTLIPIPERLHGLPPFYTVLDLMQEQCGSDAKLVKIYYIDPMDQYYEFKIKGKNILFNGLSLLPVDPKDVITPAGYSSDPEFEKTVKQEWKKHGL